MRAPVCKVRAWAWAGVGSLECWDGCVVVSLPLYRAGYNVDFRINRQGIMLITEVIR